jgi:hypothetical protein
MTGHKRDLFCDNTQSWPPAPARLDGLNLDDLLWFSADVREVDLPARCIVENQDLALRPVPQKAGNFLGAAGGDLSKPFECRIRHDLNIPG